jgi:DNA-binding NarL/FixJ family response regulator
VQDHHALSAKPAAAGSRLQPRRLNVSVITDDDLSAFGLLAFLSTAPEIAVLAEGHDVRSDVAVFVVATVTNSVLQRMKAVPESAEARQCLVLVTDDLYSPSVVSAVAAGVVSVLSRSELTAANLAHAIMASAAGEAVLPGHVMRRVIERNQAFERLLLQQHGIASGGFTVRELEIMKLLAEGLSAAAIAQRMSYAERTIKNIIQEMLSRTGSRNRTQAVARAFQIGALS